MNPDDIKKIFAPLHKSLGDLERSLKIGAFFLTIAAILVWTMVFLG